MILKPVDLARGNRRLIYDVVNRGNKRLVQFFNDAPPSNTQDRPEHAGNGFLMRRGYSLVWCGWQGDIVAGDDRMTMRLPTPVDNDGPHHRPRARRTHRGGAGHSIAPV